MLTPSTVPTQSSGSLFAQVNAFVGVHVDCTDIGPDVRYEVTLTARTGECVVHAQCICGMRASFIVRSDAGRALMSVTRRHWHPAVERGADSQHA